MITITLIIMGLFSCLSTKDTAYFYGTQEFKDKVEKFEISIDQAVTISAKYTFQKDEEIMEAFTSLQIIYKDYHIFSTYIFDSKSGKYN